MTNQACETKRTNDKQVQTHTPIPGATYQLMPIETRYVILVNCSTDRPTIILHHAYRMQRYFYSYECER